MNEKKARSTKKWLLGCGIALLVVIVVAAIISYLLVKKTKTFMQSLKESPALYTTLLEKDNYQPPADLIISEDDLKQYLQVTAVIRQRIDQWATKEKTSINWNDKRLKLDLVAKMYDVREIEAEVLQKYRFSLRKYKWITRQLVIIYGGEWVKEMNLYLQVIGSEQPPINSVNELKKIPEENLDLLDRYHQEVEEATKLWVLGL